VEAWAISNDPLGQPLALLLLLLKQPHFRLIAMMSPMFELFWVSISLVNQAEAEEEQLRDENLECHTFSQIPLPQSPPQLLQAEEHPEATFRSAASHGRLENVEC